MFEETLPTLHDNIKVFASDGSPADMADRIERYCQIRDYAAIVLEIKKFVQDCSPIAPVLRIIAGHAALHGAHTRAAAQVE